MDAAKSAYSTIERLVGTYTTHKFQGAGLSRLAAGRGSRGRCSRRLGSGQA